MLEAWSTQIVVKVKEPQPIEYDFMRPEAAIKADPSLAKGVNIYKEKIIYQAVAEAFGAEKKIGLKKPDNSRAKINPKPWNWEKSHEIG